MAVAVAVAARFSNRSSEQGEGEVDVLHCNASRAPYALFGIISGTIWRHRVFSLMLQGWVLHCWGPAAMLSSSWHVVGGIFPLWRAALMPAPAGLLLAPHSAVAWPSFGPAVGRPLASDQGGACHASWTEESANIYSRANTRHGQGCMPALQPVHGTWEPGLVGLGL